MKRKAPKDLLDEDPIYTGPTQPDPPVSKGIDILSTLEGKSLETMTRTNRAIVAGILSGSAFAYRYKSQYISDQTDRLMRVAISRGGEGRKDIIEIIRAGGQMPDAFYNTANPVDYAADE